MDLHQEEIRNRQRQERLWTARLIVDYDNACYCHRLKLRRPVIQVGTMANKWGLWDPETRVITISSSLIEKYSWFIVVEILKHEIAHQIVTDIFMAQDGHGELFAKACEMLGVTDWAARASGDLPGGISDWKTAPPTNDEESRLLRRVEKLLALASSENEHEAALAMQRVQEIYARHNIDRLENKRESSMVSLLISHGKKRVPRHLLTICGLLNDFFFVRVIHTSEFHAQDLCDYKAVELLGTRENVLMAEYVYYFLLGQLDSLWKNYRRATDCAAAAKRSYLSGILYGFREKLEKSQWEQTQSKHALVLLKDPDLEKFVSLRFPRLVNVRHGAGSYDAESYDAGRQEGRRLVIHKGIENHDGNRGRLLSR